MDFPTFEKNATAPTQAVTIDPPAFDAEDARTAEERWLDQQWRDAAASGVAKIHPLSINRDSDHVTADPYSE